MDQNQNDTIVFYVPMKLLLPEGFERSSAYKGVLPVHSDNNKLIGCCIFDVGGQAKVWLPGHDTLDPVFFKIKNEMDFYVMLKLDEFLPAVEDAIHMIEHVDSVVLVLSEAPVTSLSKKYNLGGWIEK